GTPQVFDFQSVSGTRLVLGGAPADLPPEMLHRLVRRVLVQRGITRPTFAEQRIQPDGSSLLVVAFAEA
ncbi:MAG TPA: hypothetical protein VFE22_01070, partial [Edaphobacter sp.]|nr:hypothetical protein [Edaphobacter sp.]